MKKIGICTLYFANNFGAILQAFALQETLINMGHEVEFIKIKDVLPKLEEPNSKEFERSKTYLKVAKEIYNKEKHNYDTIVIGSDELWNFKNGSFEHLDEYFGYNFNCANIITYAPSANGTTPEIFKNANGDKITFDNLKSISVRDKHSQDLVKALSGRDATLVLDPTLLVENFEKYIKYPENNLKDYIVIYGYNFSDTEIKKITEFAKANNKTIYSLGFKKDWCETLNADIFEFLGYIKNADYMITNTFHGTLFSIILEKEFAVFSNHSSKLEDVLTKFDLTDRDAMDKESLDSILKENIDYNKVNNLKEKHRSHSLAYLKENI